ncbi:stromal antigen isoform X2 [Choristoneura fumiferana]|uniref:stromal antigen isoform X2 n=1 Tax=Choristoneura fumiferana TaxID=7141 RepID=UPI003D158FEB
MHRRGGKRIRMDDPPPEYVNPMTPATPMTDYGGQSVHEPETPNINYSGFNVGTVANSTAVEPLRDEDDSHHEEDDLRSPSPAPTKRVTRSRGRGGDGGYVGRLAESPPPPPLRPRRGRGGRGRGRGRGAPPPPAYSPPPMLLPGDDENSLYNILRFNKTAINQVVDMWIEQYKSNREHALVQLMQFFINSSGCRGKVSPDMAQMDHTLIIKKMTQEFDEESGEYPLIMSGQTWKKFRANFCEFIQTLVKMCQYSIIYDQYLMDNIISLLTGLSDSQVRAFRHTATLAVMKLMTALVDVALLTSVNCDNCLRQYEAERLKARDKRASERLEVLVAKRQELEENMEEIKNMLSYMFKSVFVHRYRDTLPDIRAITMAEIGIWMEKFPAHFLDDLYLKYIGWTLHDKVGEVRLRCLQALQPLYECEELKGKLELFTSKFKDRIVAMSLDKETEVAVHAVRLVIAILKMHPDVLTDKDCENVYELVYSSCRAVAAAAGEFLNVRLFRAEPPPAEPPRSRRGKLRLPNTPLIRDLVQFFIESELHEHGAYLVDSLIESNPMMKDWECMTDLLLEEPGPGEEALDNRQESSLIELMVCCVRQASSGEPPVGRGLARKGAAPPARELVRAAADERARLTAHFAAALPALLDKFGADPEKLANLVAIPQYFEPELYTTHRQEANLTLLLNKLRDIVSVQTEAEVLETCGRTLEYLCEAQCAATRQCVVARATITDMCVNRYKEAIDEYRSLVEGGEEPDADEVFNVVNSLRKVSIMYMCHDLNDTHIWDSLFEDLPKCLKQTDMPAQALVYVVRCLFYSLLWSLHELEEKGGGAGGAAGSAPVLALRERLHSYTALCKDIVARGHEPQLREEVPGGGHSWRRRGRRGRRGRLRAGAGAARASAQLHRALQGHRGARPRAAAAGGGVHEPVRPADLLRGAAGARRCGRGGRGAARARAGAGQRPAGPAQRLHSGVRLRATQLRRAAYRGAAQAAQLPGRVLQADRVQRGAHPPRRRRLQALHQVLQRLRRHHQGDAVEGARDQQAVVRAHHAAGHAGAVRSAAAATRRAAPTAARAAGAEGTATTPRRLYGALLQRHAAPHRQLPELLELKVRPPHHAGCTERCCSDTPRRTDSCPSCWS